MRRLRVALAGMLLGFVITIPAEALTVREVIELSKAGLTEEVLLALIEVDRGVYPIDADTLKALKAAGVSERVIVALVRSGREPLPEPVLPVEEAVESAAPQPQVVIVDRPAPEVREVAVPVPVYVPVAPVRHYPRRHRDYSSPVESTYVPFQSGPPAQRPVVVEEPREPVYWGHGGKRRSDAWDPPPRPERKRDQKP